MPRGVITTLRSIASRRSALALTSAVVAGTLLAAAPPSQADDVAPAARFAAGSPAMQIAQAVAQANWGVNACAGQVTVEWGTDAANINARSYWANPLSSYDNPDLNVQCRIVFNGDMTYTWPKFCTVLVHEYGHLTGHPHTADGPDVMSPIYRAPLGACSTADPTAGAAPAPVASTVATTPPAASTTIETVARRTVRSARGVTRAKGRAVARARMATAPVKRFSDADVEPMPWAPFAAEQHRPRLRRTG
jgi:hypothetical protein